MPSNWSNSLRLELQIDGENLNTWGDRVNVDLSHVDFAIAGCLTKALTGDYVLTTSDSADDEARAAILKFTGAGPFTVTIPPVSKTYQVWNTCTGVVTLTTGSGATASVQPGEVVTVATNGSDVERVVPTNFSGQRLQNVADPINPQDVATKAYADQLAFTANAGILPGQGVVTNGQALFSNGSNAFWKSLQTSDLSDFKTAILGIQVALAVAL